MPTTDAQPAHRDASVPRPRTIDFGFDATIPRHWFGGSPIATHVVNGVNLLFPLGERFFVRSVRHFLREIEKDPRLLERVRGFSGQEGRHARAHEDFFEVLRTQGYDVDRFLAIYDRLAYDWLERVTTPRLRLAATAAAEHFTAIMAENALTEPYLDHAHPTMRALLRWHAAEEIEHKSIAFDVLQRVDPRYSLRVAGLCFATATLAGFWFAATLALLAQDRARGVDLRAADGEFARLPREGGIATKVFLRGIRAYLRRDFHPDDLDNRHLAEAYLIRAGLA
jgi:predicted metal-dependent hydrolase